MSPHLATTLAYFKQQLSVLEANFEKERASILATIEGIESHLGKDRKVPSERTGRPGRKPGRPVGRPAKGSKPPTRASGPPEVSPGERSTSSLILEAIKAQTAQFTITDVRAYVETRYPTEVSRISASRISKELYSLRGRSVVTLLQKGAKGGANTYRYNADSR